MSFTAKLLGAIFVIAITFFLAVSIGNVLLGLDKSVEKDNSNIKIDSFNVKFEEMCDSSKIRVDVKKYRVDNLTNKSQPYISVFNNNNKFGSINNKSSIIVNTPKKGEIKLVPYVKLEYGSVINFDNNSRVFEYNCE